MLSKKIGLDHIAKFIPKNRVLLRVDFNVPIQNGKIIDNTKIVAAIPTIQKILSSGAKSLILMSHLGRPNGHKKQELSLKPIMPMLEGLLEKKVIFLGDCVSLETQNACNSIHNGYLIMLENLRFHLEEEGSIIDDNNETVKADKINIKRFHECLTKLGDIYINDAFSTTHKAHASVVGIDLPIRAAGYLLKKELDYFSKILETPSRPYLAILGGDNLKDKIQLINSLLDKVDDIIIGGAIAFPFLRRVHKIEIGNSSFDGEGFKSVDSILHKARDKNVKIHLPVDFICSDKKEGGNLKICNIKTGIDHGWMGLDIGEQTIAINSSIISKAKSIVWNGPQGLYEVVAFRKGTISILEDLMRMTIKGAITIAGGNDTVALIQSVKAAEQKLSHVSAGASAFYELLAGKTLPGINHLINIEELKVYLKESRLKH